MYPLVKEFKDLTDERQLPLGVSGNLLASQFAYL